MKRIEFIAPVEALRGNMSGKQTLVYAQNDNPAFDAPEGRQYARNYKPRYIGYRRAKDGRVYFGVKTKSATKVDAASKITMAALGSIQDLKTTFKDESIIVEVAGIPGTYWSWVLYAYNYGVTNGEIDPSITADKWIDGVLMDMLRYRQSTTELRFKVNPNSPTVNTLTINSPYSEMEEKALPISLRIFIKFNPTLSTMGEHAMITIDGIKIAVPSDDPMMSWADLRAAVSQDSANYTALLEPLAAEGTSPVTWRGDQLYNSTGVVQTGASLLVDGGKYFTSIIQS